MNKENLPEKAGNGFFVKKVDFKAPHECIKPNVLAEYSRDIKQIARGTIWQCGECGIQWKLIGYDYRNGRYVPVWRTVMFRRGRKKFKHIKEIKDNAS